MAPKSQIFRMQDFEEKSVTDLNFLSEIEKEYFEERAAIMEYDGGFIKCQAEHLAYQLVLQRRERFSKAS